MIDGAEPHYNSGLNATSFRDWLAVNLFLVLFVIGRETTGSGHVVPLFVKSGNIFGGKQGPQPRNEPFNCGH